MRRRFFRQIASNFRRNTDVFQGDFGENDGKFAERWCAKPLGGLCAGEPKVVF